MTTRVEQRTGPAQVVAICFADAPTPTVGSDPLAARRLRAEDVELRALARWEDDGGSLSTPNDEGTLGTWMGGR